MNTTEPETLRFGLKESTITKILAVFAQYPQIHKVILYGSRAKGNYRNGSDIDLTITGEITYTDLAKIEDEIDDLFLPYTFDISILSDIDNQALIEHINRIGIVFYELSTPP